MDSFMYNLVKSPLTKEVENRNCWKLVKRACSLDSDVFERSISYVHRLVVKVMSDENNFFEKKERRAVKYENYEKFDNEKFWSFLISK